MRHVLAYIDYYDSFSNNLIDWLERQEFEVRRTYFDKLTIDSQFFSSFQGCILSPGPGDPSAMFAQIEFAKTMLALMPVFGVCLGHQLLSLAHNGAIARDPKCFHGSTRQIIPLNSETPFDACLYNSLVVENVDQESVVARCENNTIQAVKFPANDKWHRSAGVQFHPESFQSEQCQIFTSKLLNWCLEGR
jgi:anthranilate/para-aminobenzoate synthase component II